MKTSPPILERVQLEESINFKAIESKVFTQKGDSIYVGGELIGETMRSLLRDQARSLQTSNLFEILDATITNEASSLLLQAGTVEHLQYGKALHYWNKILKKTINALAK